MDSAEVVAEEEQQRLQAEQLLLMQVLCSSPLQADVVVAFLVTRSSRSHLSLFFVCLAVSAVGRQSISWSAYRNTKHHPQRARQMGDILLEQG